MCCESDDETRKLSLLYRRSSVQKRHSVLLTTSEAGHPAPQSFFPDRDVQSHGPTTAQRMQRFHAEAAPLAADAARRALENGDVDPSHVTHLVTVSCTGFAAPGVDIGLIERLPLPASTQRTHLGFMGCHGALNGLRVANAFLSADPSACVLLCAVELCSLHHQYGWRDEQILANALFADGAAALVGVGQKKRPDAAWRAAAFASTVVPDTTDMMGWRIGDHGFEMQLSPKVPAMIEEHLGGWLSEWLAREGFTLDGVPSWAVHPGGPKILHSAAQAAGFPTRCLAESEAVLAEFGNMSSPTILMIIDRLRRGDAPRPCVALAFGPGLTIEAALFV
jgi:predicted naringenin-chalcone synthase